MGYIGTKPADAALTPSDIADGIITATKLATDSVETAKVKDLNVSAGKLAATQDLSTKTITLPASVSGLGTGITAGQLTSTLDISSKTLTLPASVSGLGTGITNAQLAGSIDVTTKITGKVPVANLGTGTASSSTYLAGDQTYKALSEFDDDNIKNDLATLVLHQATNANAAKYNLVNTNVDQYEDSTGIASFTDCVRDTGGEFISSAVSVSGNDSNTTFLLSNDTNPATDISGTGMSVTASGLTYSSTYAKFGTYSWYFPGSSSSNTFTFGSASTPEHEWFGTASGTAADATLELWYNSAGFTSDCRFWTKVSGPDYQMYNRPNGQFYYAGLNNSPSLNGNNAWIPSDSTWHHYAWDMYNNIFKLYIDGVLKETSGTNSGTPVGNNAANLIFGTSADGWQRMQGYIDTMRISDISRYEGASSFTPPTTPTYDSSSVNATGNYISTATTANASVSSLGAVIIYKNEDGTNTLNTDIVLEVSANGGSNYTTVVLTAGGTFSTGILQAVANDISVTAGTSIQYRISFANQSSGSKEARIYGASLMY